jgi:hypothetical protein
VPATLTGSNASATLEPGEPQTSCASGSAARTVWFRLVAPQTTTITLTTEGSDFDTLLTVYTGSSLASLNEVGCDDDIMVGLRASLLSFPATAGQTYFVQIAGFNNVPGGNYTLQALLPPPNDSFASAQAIPVPTSLTGSNRAATVESGEPTPSCASIGRTLWYRFTPNQDGSVTITVAGSETLDASFAVYTGSSLASLSEVACREVTGRNGTEQTSVTVTGGVTYFIQLGGFSDTFGDVHLTVGSATVTGSSVASAVLRALAPTSTRTTTPTPTLTRTPARIPTRTATLTLTPSVTVTATASATAAATRTATPLRRAGGLRDERAFRATSPGATLVN